VRTIIWNVPGNVRGRNSPLRRDKRSHAAAVKKIEDGRKIILGPQVFGRVHIMPPNNRLRLPGNMEQQQK
jgi:hypothetical protein